MNKIIQRNGKEYLRISENIWKKYLDSTSKYRDINNSFKYNCSLKNNKDIWCNYCNRGIGSWSNSCIKIITSINLVKYENIFLDNDSNSNMVEIEIDRNLDNKVI